jgi:hypothetical protein
MGWMLTVLFVVLVAAYAFFLFLLSFVADINNVDSLRFTAVFMLLAAVVTFAVLMFTGSGTMLEEIPQEESDALPAAPAPPVPVTDVAETPMICASCGQENPAAARFCFACGASFRAAHDAPTEEGPDARDDEPDEV